MKGIFFWNCAVNFCKLEVFWFASLDMPWGKASCEKTGVNYMNLSVFHRDFFFEENCIILLPLWTPRPVSHRHAGAAVVQTPPPRLPSESPLSLGGNAVLRFTQGATQGRHDVPLLCMLVEMYSISCCSQWSQKWRCLPQKSLDDAWIWLKFCCEFKETWVLPLKPPVRWLRCCVWCGKGMGYQPPGSCDPLLPQTFGGHGNVALARTCCV